MPWKQLGRKWHLLKKGLPKSPDWNFKTLEKLLPIVEASYSNHSIDFGVRSKISWAKKKTNTPVAELHTKRKNAVELHVFVPKDSVTVGAVAEFGKDQEIKPHKDGTDVVRLSFTSPDEISASLAKWIKTFE